MIISWFTQPPNNGFSSYYQYDTRTRQFVRIRLELARSGEGTGGAPCIIYKKLRSVGFAPQKFRVSKTNLKEWKISDDGMLLYGKNFLTVYPKKGLYVLDCTPSVAAQRGFNTAMHRGNIVTEHPILPEGIDKLHLQLIANECFIECEDSADLPLIEMSILSDMGKKIKTSFLSCLGSPSANEQTPFPNNEANRKLLKERIEKIVSNIMNCDCDKVIPGAMEEKIEEQRSLINKRGEKSDNREMIEVEAKCFLGYLNNKIQIEIENGSYTPGDDIASEVSHGNSYNDFYSQIEKCLRNYDYEDLNKKLSHAKYEVESIELKGNGGNMSARFSESSDDIDRNTTDIINDTDKLQKSYTEDSNTDYNTDRDEKEGKNGISDRGQTENEYSSEVSTPTENSKGKIAAHITVGDL